MRGERDCAACRLEHIGRHVAPERRTGNVAVNDVMDRHRYGRDRPPGVDEQRPALVVDRPAAIFHLDHILPADFANVVRRRARAGRLKIYDADTLHRSDMGLVTRMANFG